jgi:putative SOS response-associated peptidase YedK
VEDVAGIFEVDDIEVPEELLAPRWNVAPQAGVLAVRTRLPKPPEPDDDRAPDGGGPGELAAQLAPKRSLTDFRWGLVPSWARDSSVGIRSINARAETLLEKGSFRTALAKRRCIIPADAFYEWRREGSVSQPWCFRPPGGAMFGFAGLYEVWRPKRPDMRDDGPGWHGDWLLTCSIITTEANAVVRPTHDRMPAILAPDDWEAWLDPTSSDEAVLLRLLKPAAEDAIQGFRVPRLVNNARAEGPELIQPLEDEPAEQPRLFG